jgi:hypothetical protein
MRRRVAWAIIALLALGAIAVLTLMRADEGVAQLTVHLRCAEGEAGSLSIETLSGTKQRQEERAFDLKEACAAGSVTLERFSADQGLHFRVLRQDGRTGELDANYGPDIQRDQDGFYTVLRIFGSAPFLANDRI